MGAPVFSNVVSAIEYLESSDFQYGTDIATYDGRRVLLLLQLDSSAAACYQEIKSSTSKKIWKEAAILATRELGLDAIKVVAKSSRGDIFGTLGSMFSLGGKATSGGGGAKIDETISASSSEGALYLRFEKAFRLRSIDPGVYMYAKETLRLSDAHFTERREGELGGKLTFMYTL